jgi:hypothetical protein
MTSHCQFATCNLSPATMPVVTYVNVIGWRHCLVATESYASRGTNIYRQFIAENRSQKSQPQSEDICEDAEFN